MDIAIPAHVQKMSNHWQGQAVGTARQLKLLMEGKED